MRDLRVLLPRPATMILSFLILGVVVAANNAAVAVAIGAVGGMRRRVRVVLVFGIVEFLVPLVGIGLGRSSASRLEGIAGWVAPALLLLLGLWAIREGFRDGSTDSRIERALTAWGPLILLALGLSTDNLLVGFSLGLRGHDPLAVAGLISVFSMLFAWIGITLGARTGRRWEKVVKLGAGALLVALAVGVWVGWV